MKGSNDEAIFHGHSDDGDRDTDRHVAVRIFDWNYGGCCFAYLRYSGLDRASDTVGREKYVAIAIRAFSGQSDGCIRADIREFYESDRHRI